MSRSLFIGLAAIAGVAAAPMALADEGAIIVSGPRVQNSGDAKVGVHPQRELVAHAYVPIHDLDLRTSYGRNVLNHRVKLAAAEVCNEMHVRVGSTGVRSNPMVDDRDCRIEAESSARRQVNAAYWAAG